MAIYAFINHAGRALSGASAAGWAVPMATGSPVLNFWLNFCLTPASSDIAFAMGVFGFFKSRMPAGAEAFLLTLATVDDLGAIAVIAVCFAGSISLPFLTAALAIVAGLILLSRRAGAADLRVYALAGFALWYALLRGGINADIAGVVTAMALPAPANDKSLFDQLHHLLAPWTALIVMPVFALANTAVVLSGSAASLAGKCRLCTSLCESHTFQPRLLRKVLQQDCSLASLSAVS